MFEIPKKLYALSIEVDVNGANLYFQKNASGRTETSGEGAPKCNSNYKKHSRESQLRELWDERRL